MKEEIKQIEALLSEAEKKRGEIERVYSESDLTLDVNSITKVAMINERIYTLKEVLAILDEEQTNTEALEKGNQVVTLKRICRSCNKEFTLNNIGINGGTGAMLSNFENCPHCGERNDIWVAVEITNTNKDE